MISGIDTYIAKFNTENNKESLLKWVYDHPTAVKVIQLALVVFGALAILTSPLSFIFLGVGAAIGIAVGGVLAVLASVVSWIFINYVTCKSSDINQHVFKESECEGGRLYYQGNVPILELNGATPRQSGYAHGFLLGPHIHSLKANFDKAIYGILRQPKAKELQQMLTEFYAIIPKAFQEEMEGLADGYNHWAAETDTGNVFLTKDDIMLMHLIPESKHFHTKEMTEKALQKKAKKVQEEKVQGLPDFAACACTSILAHSREGKLIFGRVMDWCPFGDGGAKSLVMVWRDTGVAVLGVPGMIGAIQGWNRSNLAVAMNVCPGETHEMRGVPAAFFNRMVLENASTLEEVRRFTRFNRPLGPYHLTVADQFEQGMSLSFYQEEDNRDFERISEPKDPIPLLVVNWRYPECKGGSFKSQERTTMLTDYFEKAPADLDRSDQYKLVANALRLNLVNSPISMHSMMIEPGLDVVSMSWGNGYAASQDPQTIKMSSVFENMPSLEIGAVEVDHDIGIAEDY